MLAKHYALSKTGSAGGIDYHFEVIRLAVSLEIFVISVVKKLIAAIYLEKHGYEIISRRTRIGHSEIDITARDIRDGTVVFVEVKTRRMNPSPRSYL